ncbi:protein boule-like [Genypterus blacodes]|uniref:protein boule-like n=1 Tax=Genypterus blacodes TaxID=154954 RepID=UPI003F7572C2
MEVETQTICSSSRTPSPSCPPPGKYSGPHQDLSLYASGIVIPNRIFVGRLHYKVNADDLRRIFSSFGAVKDAKIVVDHGGLSKGYGFVTFETNEDAMKVLIDDTVYIKEKKVNIGPAVYKRQASGHAKSVSVAGVEPATSTPIHCRSLYMTTTNGFPYTYHNGVAYFHQSPAMNTHAQHPPTACAPLVYAQSPPLVYQPAAYSQYQCVPNQVPWNVVQAPVASSPVMFAQPYQHNDEAAAPPPLQAPEDTKPQTEGILPWISGKVTEPSVQSWNNQMFQPSMFNLRPNFRRRNSRRDRYYLPYSPETAGDAILDPQL